MERKEKQEYLKPVVAMYKLELETKVLGTSFRGGHEQGITADDGIDQGGSHEEGEVGEDIGD
mgnify:CR=1 FL=1|jgi:hypothetical protein